MPRASLDLGDLDGFDLAGEGEQRPRKPRRKLQARRSVNALQIQGGGNVVFTDPSLAALHVMGVIHELLGELKSGKEAVVYLARGDFGLAAVKLYKDLAARSFKNDAVYREGRHVGDDRIEKAIRQRSSTGVSAQQAMWVIHEYRELWTLWEAGLPVPRPLVGPGPHECAKASRAVAMQFIGNEEDAAPRLSEAHLTLTEARFAWTQSLDILAAFLRLGRVHGDFSTYNLLWHEGRVIVIDFPQVVLKSESRAFDALLERDVRSLCTSFARLGVREDPASTLREVQRRARQSAQGVSLP